MKRRAPRIEHVEGMTASEEASRAADWQLAEIATAMHKLAKENARLENENHHQLVQRIIRRRLEHH